eukprot:Seg6295.2 transcript_id=Seg6295.2/GoldUCD/mRNA.D3Y31 product="hypothetical protein" protein_id=Seg6295.2/GoldUCD/D3Y31
MARRKGTITGRRERMAAKLRIKQKREKKRLEALKYKRKSIRDPRNLNARSSMTLANKQREEQNCVSTNLQEVQSVEDLPQRCFMKARSSLVKAQELQRRGGTPRIKLERIEHHDSEPTQNYANLGSAVKSENAGQSLSNGLICSGSQSQHGGHFGLVHNIGLVQNFELVQDWGLVPSIGLIPNNGSILIVHQTVITGQIYYMIQFQCGDRFDGTGKPVTLDLLLTEEHLQALHQHQFNQGCLDEALSRQLLHAMQPTQQERLRQQQQFEQWQQQQKLLQQQELQKQQRLQQQKLQQQQQQLKQQQQQQPIQQPQQIVAIASPAADLTPRQQDRRPGLSRPTMPRPVSEGSPPNKQMRPDTARHDQQKDAADALLMMQQQVQTPSQQPQQAVTRKSQQDIIDKERNKMLAEHALGTLEGAQRKSKQDITEDERNKMLAENAVRTLDGVQIVQYQQAVARKSKPDITDEERNKMLAENAVRTLDGVPIVQHQQAVTRKSQQDIIDKERNKMLAEHALGTLEGAQRESKPDITDEERNKMLAEHAVRTLDGVQIIQYQGKPELLRVITLEKWLQSENGKSSEREDFERVRAKRAKEAARQAKIRKRHKKARDAWEKSQEEEVERLRKTVEQLRKTDKRIGVSCGIREQDPKQISKEEFNQNKQKDKQQQNQSGQNQHREEGCGWTGRPRRVDIEKQMQGNDFLKRMAERDRPKRTKEALRVAENRRKRKAKAEAWDACKRQEIDSLRKIIEQYQIENREQHGQRMENTESQKIHGQDSQQKQVRESRQTGEENVKQMEQRGQQIENTESQNIHGQDSQQKQARESRQTGEENVKQMEQENPTQVNNLDQNKQAVPKQQIGAQRRMIRIAFRKGKKGSTFVSIPKEKELARKEKERLVKDAARAAENRRKRKAKLDAWDESKRQEIERLQRMIEEEKHEKESNKSRREGEQQERVQRVENKESQEIGGQNPVRKEERDLKRTEQGCLQHACQHQLKQGEKKPIEKEGVRNIEGLNSQQNLRQTERKNPKQVNKGDKQNVSKQNQTNGDKPGEEGCGRKPKLIRIEVEKYKQESCDFSAEKEVFERLKARRAKLARVAEDNAKKTAVDYAELQETGRQDSQQGLQEESQEIAPGEWQQLEWIHSQGIVGEESFQIVSKQSQMIAQLDI